MPSNLNAKAGWKISEFLTHENLVWVYSLSHTYPQYIGAGTYRRLAILFLQEAAEENE